MAKINNFYSKHKNLLITLLSIFIILLVWGLIGGNEAHAIGVTCDVGLGENLCWKWHLNDLGEFGEAVSDLF